jgi:hypothetical protein
MGAQLWQRAAGTNVNSNGVARSCVSFNDANVRDIRNSQYGIFHSRKPEIIRLAKLYGCKHSRLCTCQPLFKWFVALEAEDCDSIKIGKMQGNPPR